MKREPGPQPRLAVALETSTRSPSVAVHADGEVRARDLGRERAHASDLLPALAALLSELERAPRDIEAVLVGLGPGSYTGLRVGVATALGLARAAAADVLGVPSGEALAWERLSPGEEAVHVIDARSGELYVSRLGRDERDVRALEGPSVLAPTELHERLRGDERVLADAAAREAAGLDDAARVHADVDVIPSAAALLELGLARMTVGARTPLAELRPLYLRPFAARVRRR